MHLKDGWCVMDCVVTAGSAAKTIPHGCTKCNASKECEACGTTAELTPSPVKKEPRCPPKFECKATTDGKGCKVCMDNKSGCATCHTGWENNEFGRCQPTTMACVVGVNNCKTCAADLKSCTACKLGTPVNGKCPPPCTNGERNCKECDTNGF